MTRGAERAKRKSISDGWTAWRWSRHPGHRGRRHAVFLARRRLGSDTPPMANSFSGSLSTAVSQSSSATRPNHGAPVGVKNRTILLRAGCLQRSVARVPSLAGPPVAVTTLPDGVETGHRWPSLLPGARRPLQRRNAGAGEKKAEPSKSWGARAGKRRPLLRGASYARYIEWARDLRSSGPSARGAVQPVSPRAHRSGGFSARRRPGGSRFDGPCLHRCPAGRGSGARAKSPGAPRPGERRRSVWIE